MRLPLPFFLRACRIHDRSSEKTQEERLPQRKLSKAYIIFDRAYHNLSADTEIMSREGAFHFFAECVAW